MMMILDRKSRCTRLSTSSHFTEMKPKSSSDVVSWRRSLSHWVTVLRTRWYKPPTNRESVSAVHHDVLPHFLNIKSRWSTQIFIPINQKWNKISWMLTPPSFTFRDCVIANGGRSLCIEVLLMHMFDQSWVSLSCQSWCFTSFLFFLASTKQTSVGEEEPVNWRTPSLAAVS